MAKQHVTQPYSPASSSADVSVLEARAWELFARNLNVIGTATNSREHLARQCFLAATEFANVAREPSTNEGNT